MNLIEKQSWLEIERGRISSTEMWRRYSKRIKIWEVPWEYLGALDTDYYFPGLTRQLVSDIRASQCISASAFIAQDTPNPRGFIQLFLLKTEPFDFDGALTDYKDRIRDIHHPNPKHTRSCQDRLKLLESLAMALGSFRLKLHRRYIDTEKRLWKIQRCPKEIGEVLNIYFDLRTQGILAPKPGIKHLHRSTVEQAYKTIAEVINGFTPEDCAAIVRYSALHVSDNDAKLELITKMWRCFEDYGPRSGPTQLFSQDAKYHAIAAILLKFKIEEGNRSTVVSRIRKRLQRASE
jgi:hypothetical protein